MRTLGTNTFQKEKSIKIFCLGKVICWNENDKTFEINPIAIF